MRVTTKLCTLGALLASLLFCASCASTPQGPDPFDVAIGMAAASIMTDKPASDATMRAFAEAVKAPTIIQQTVVQEPAKLQQGGGQ
jgi:hypothetical protein